MTERKVTRKYYFSVEGETEKWYLEHLQSLINNAADATCRVLIDVKVQRNPIKRVKEMVIQNKIEIVQMTDYEENTPAYEKSFIEMLDNMKKAESLGKKVKYYLGYSNLTFELWMILHKIDCFKTFADRKQYLDEINKAYKKKYLSLKDYKEEKNFKECLKQIGLDEVKQAIKRSKAIANINATNGNKLQKYKGFEYYRENPSLSVWEALERMVRESGM